MLPADLDEDEDNVDEVYPEQLGSRYYVQLKDFQLKLQVSLNVNGEEKNTNVRILKATLSSCYSEGLLLTGLLVLKF